jgi:rhamnulose-1-phosphate aldolase
MIEQPYPSLESLMNMIGSAGKRMSEINASEGTAGNISVCVRWDLDVKRLFPNIERITLPQPVPSLAGAKIIVSGSGTSIRDIQDQPTANLACLIVNSD